VADVAADGMELGGRGTRLLAALLDSLLSIAVFWLIGKVTPFNLFDPTHGPLGLKRLVLTLLVAAFVFALMQGWLLATQGQTIGKRLLGLRIVRPDGERASIARLIGLRYGVGFVVAIIPVVNMLYSLIDSLLIFRESRRCLHDNIADTIVVKA
jgi:uncharacterized RDD family membrane protein YckC